MAVMAVAALGAWIAPAGYAAVGWAIGSAVGTYLFTPAIEGPRLNDLKVQGSSYGAMLPIVYGTVRISGNVIWSADIQEHRHRGGKGGPKTNTYTYTVSMALAICEGPIVGVRKIWADGKLIYNMGSDATAETIVASTKYAKGITFYLGDEAQLPDPVMESAKGVGNVPAYRGQAYIVVEDFELEDFGNRRPNFTVEVMAAASELGYRRLAAVDPISVQFETNTIPGVGRPAILSSDGVIRVTVLGSTLVYLFNMAGSFLGTDQRELSENFPAPRTTAGATYTYPVGLIGGLRLRAQWLDQPIGTKIILPCFLPSVAGDGMIATGNEVQFDLSATLPAGEFVGGVAIATSGNHAVVVTAPTPATAGSDIVNKWYLVDHVGAVIRSGTIAVPFSIYELGFGNSSTHHFGCSSLEGDLRHIWAAYGAGSGTVRCYSLDDDNVMREVGVLGGGAGLPEFQFTYPSIWADNGVAFAFSGDTFSSFTRLPGLTQGTVALSSIVSNLSTRAGLAGGDINVTALTDTVEGYVIARQASVRSAIEPLQSGFFFDAVESNNTLKYVKRGGASAATISTSDLAAHTHGSAMPDQLPIARQQEVELPASVNVVYVNKGADYQQSTQQSKRITVQSQQAISVELPIVMLDNKARQVAEVLMFDAWTQRVKYQALVSRKYALVEPTDVITVTSSTATHTLRVTKKDEGRGGVIKLEAVAELGAVYTQISPGGGSLVPDPTIPLAGPTKLALMDIPMLRDSDNDWGYYAAARGFTTTWPGSVLYKSIDGGASYGEIDSFLTAAVIGSADNVLGNFTGGNVFDEHSTVNITLLGGSLSSTTELAVLNGANAILLGSELIQFKTATLTAALKYRLSGLLRGRKGTEWAMTTHAANERFVLLDTSSVKRIGSDTDYNTYRSFKAVTIGASIQSTASQLFRNTAVNKRAYAPVLLGGGRASNGDLTITWVRRSRLNGGWNDYVDVPLGESAESYSITIMDSNFTIVRRDMTSATQTVTYTAAMQTSDFGSPQALIEVRVNQAGETGTGYSLQGII